MNPIITAQKLRAPSEDSDFGGGHDGTSDPLAETGRSFVRTARATATQIKERATDTVNRAKEQAARVATERKTQAANRVGGYSSAIHESARALEEKDPNIAWFTHQAADRLQGVADYVRTRDFDGLREDAENMARRHPLAFFGGLFVAGLVLGNVVKASRPAGESDRPLELMGPESENNAGDARPNAGTEENPGDTSME